MTEELKENALDVGGLLRPLGRVSADKRRDARQGLQGRNLHFRG